MEFFSQASLREFGRKSFAPRKICLLLHLCGRKHPDEIATKVDRSYSAHHDFYGMTSAKKGITQAPHTIDLLNFILENTIEKKRKLLAFEKLVKSLYCTTIVGNKFKFLAT